jgi:hypothetical protein
MLIPNLTDIKKPETRLITGELVPQLVVKGCKVIKVERGF